MLRIGWIAAVVLAAAPAVAAPVYTRENAPQAPAVDELELRTSITQYGITWTFDQPVPVGQFLTGDYYFVGPATITSVTPAPTGSGSSFRNGSMLNPPVNNVSAYDGRFLNVTQAHLNQAAQFPLAIQPRDSLVSAASLDQLQPNQIIVHSSSPNETTPLRTVAVLTALAEPVPADTFRPGYADLQKNQFLRASDIQWERLPRVTPTSGEPSFEWLQRAFERPWVDHVYGWASRDMHASENMPGYGREVGRVVSLGGLKLMTDYEPEEKAALLYGMMQVGIDNFAVAERGGGWPAQGGFGNGRKFPIVLAAVMLQEERMLNIAANAPGAVFGEDQHTAFGPSWTGADVVFTGQYPDAYASDPVRYVTRGPYEHLHPSQWPSGLLGESYRRCCTSISWVGQALAVMMLHAQDVWDHDPFFAYVDRWMTEDDTEFVQAILAAGQGNYTASWARQGQAWDRFVDTMWAAYRNNLPPPLLAGDANRDGRVDGEDFLIWQGAFGTQAGATWDMGDFNGDGRVDGEDFLIWQANFGTVFSGSSAVPEPAALAGLLLAGLLVLRRRHVS